MAREKERESKEIDGALMPASFGTVMLVEPAGMNPGFKTGLSGMERGKYLMLQLPRISGLSDELYAERVVKVRYIHEGHVFGFRSAVLSYQVIPFRLLFLQFPKTVEQFNLRRGQRVDCYIPATVEFPKGLERSFRAMLTNISSGGSRAALDATGQRLPGIELGTEVGLKFKVVGTDLDVNVRAQIKSTDADGTRMFLGLNFVDLAEDDRAAIQDYVDSVSGFLDI